MQVIEYFACERQEYWLSQIQKCGWSAGVLLHELLSISVYMKSTDVNLPDDERYRR